MNNHKLIEINEPVEGSRIEGLKRNIYVENFEDNHDHLKIVISYENYIEKDGVKISLVDEIKSDKYMLVVSSQTEEQAFDMSGKMIYEKDELGNDIPVIRNAFDFLQQVLDSDINLKKLKEGYIKLMLAMGRFTKI
jgi:hypothetical protein